MGLNPPCTVWRLRGGCQLPDGELENETAAIAWLFNTHETHMKNLAKDIVDQGRIFEPPLVTPENDTFLVFDGNRRVTCLKLLAKPERAPTVPLQDYFKALREKWQGNVLNSILCQVEEDRDDIDNILYRRHTGTQNGVGQSKWDDRMKDNFVSRSGKVVGFNLADEIEQRLDAAGLRPKKKIPRSNLNRFLSSETIRKRVGVSGKNNQFSYTHKPEVVLETLRYIAEEFANKRVVLGDIWDNTAKLSYLERLEVSGWLPKDEDLLDQRSDKPETSPKTPPIKPRPKAKPTNRTTLIPQKDFGILWTGKQQRHHDIWEELQFRLNTKNHPNAVAVLFRVLLELSINYYVDEHSIAVNTNEKLARRVEKVGNALFSHGKIDKKQLSATKKFSQNYELISADTLNRYVHSASFAPSPKDLEALWDTLADLIVACLKG